MVNKEPMTPFTPILDGEESLRMLAEGNVRYVESRLSAKDTTEVEREALAESQRPFAIILCCSDSRVAPEIIFDQRLGNLFVVRNAGNVVDETVLGSMEYAVEHLGTPLIVVLAHSSCGAVTAACGDGELPPAIRSIADRIAPAVEAGKGVNDVAKRHALHMVEQIGADAVVGQAKTKVVAAYYDILTAVVSWL